MEGLDNLRRIFHGASHQTRAEAFNAYSRYNFITRRIAQDFGFEAIVGAAVFAALSPNNDYYGNLRDTRKMLQAASLGKGIDDFTVSTYGNNKRKAWAIVKGADPRELIVARKTRAFFLSVHDPSDPDPVVIDGHMYWAWRGERGVVKARTHGPRSAAVSKSIYETIADCVRSLANEVRCTANQAQATVWTGYRIMHGIQGSRQLELIAGDFLAAGISA